MDQSQVLNYCSGSFRRTPGSYLFSMAAFGSVARQFTRVSRRGVFRTVRDFSLGSTSRTSVAVVSTILV